MAHWEGWNQGTLLSLEPELRTCSFGLWGLSMVKGRMESKLPPTYRCGPSPSVTFAGAWEVDLLDTWELKS